MHSNALGSTGTITDQAGHWVDAEIYDPWGQRWATYGTPYDERFAASQERDGESGLDPTPNRMLTSQYGRWMTPDPLAGDITNPQSLNRYAYVMNNPMNGIDPLGLDTVPCGHMVTDCQPVQATYTGNRLVFEIDNAGPIPGDLIGMLGGIGPTGVGESTAVCNVPNCEFPNSAYNNANPQNPELYQYVLNPRAINFNCWGSDLSWQSYACAPSPWSKQFIGNAGGGLLGANGTFYSTYEASALATLGAAGRAAAPMLDSRTYLGWTAGAAVVGVGAVPGAWPVASGALEDGSIAFDIAHPGWIGIGIQFAQGYLTKGVPTSGAALAGRAVQIGVSVCKQFGLC